MGRAERRPCVSWAALPGTTRQYNQRLMMMMMCTSGLPQFPGKLPWLLHAPPSCACYSWLETGVTRVTQQWQRQGRGRHARNGDGGVGHGILAQQCPVFVPLQAIRFTGTKPGFFFFFGPPGYATATAGRVVFTLSSRGPVRAPSVSSHPHSCVQGCESRKSCCTCELNP